MATKDKKATPEFGGTITYTKASVGGVSLYGNKKPELTLEEVIDAAEKSDIQSARKDALVSKLRERAKQGESSPKRFTVDPATGQIDIDEEEGEYTQKEAMIVSASIKGKGGQYDAAIALMTAAKELVSSNQSAVQARPKEFLVDPETGVITQDPENGEYTLSEARAISQSLRKDKQPESQGQKSFLDKLEDMTQGLISQRFATMLGGNSQPQAPTDPVDEFLRRLDQVDKIKERFAPAGGGNLQSLAQSGIRGELLKLLLEDERERLRMQYEHDAQAEHSKQLGGLVNVVKENMGDGIRALTMAAQEAKQGTTAGPTPQSQPKSLPTQAPGGRFFECQNCATPFGIPATEWEVIGCPHCGSQYTRKQILGEPNA